MEIPQLISTLRLNEQINTASISQGKTSLDSESPHQAPHIWTVGEILNHDFGQEEWAIDQILPVSGVLVLSGMPGGYKTWITHAVALSVARGMPVFGKFTTRQGPVLFVDEENHLRLLKQRFSSLGATNHDAVHFLSLAGFKLDKQGSVETLLSEAQARRATLVIIDSLIRVHSKDENAASDMTQVLDRLKVLTKAGISVIFTHHHRKGQGFGRSNPAENLRGSSDILAFVDSHVSVEPKQESEDTLVLRMNKSRYFSPVPSFEIRIIKTERGISGLEYVGTHDEQATKAAEAADAIAAFLTDGVKSRQDIHEALKDQSGETAVDRGLKSLESTGRIERVGRAELTREQIATRRAYYRLKEL